MRKHQDQIHFFLEVARELAQRDEKFHLMHFIEKALLENAQSPNAPDLNLPVSGRAQYTPRH